MFVMIVLQKHQAGIKILLLGSLNGRYIGYLGYELKALCGGKNSHNSSMPDACLFLVDRLIAIDHKKGDVYCVAMRCLEEENARETEDWVVHSCSEVRSILAQRPSGHNCNKLSVEHSLTPVALDAKNSQGDFAQDSGVCRRPVCFKFVILVSRPSCFRRRLHLCVEAIGYGWTRRMFIVCFFNIGCHLDDGFSLNHPQFDYCERVEKCLDYMKAGESYEICLTNKLRKRTRKGFSPLGFYNFLREMNPAPYAAFLSFGEEDVSICCSSPERFLKGGRGAVLESKPIKGVQLVQSLRS